MRFIMLYKLDRRADPPPSPQEMPAVRQSIQDMTSDVTLPSEDLQRSSKRVRLRLSRKEFIITDGPFTETKELIGG